MLEGRGDDRMKATIGGEVFEVCASTDTRQGVRADYWRLGSPTVRQVSSLYELVCSMMGRGYRRTGDGIGAVKERMGAREPALRMTSGRARGPPVSAREK
jgi:hypothetical protein